MSVVPAIRAVGFAIVAGAALSGCSSHSQLGNSLVAQGVEGMWSSQGAVSISSFSRGMFQTHAGSRQLARGSYQTASGGIVHIDMQLFDGSSRRVTCNLVSANQLDCATSDSKFSLNRIS